MRRWLIFIFLVDLAATPLIIGMFAGGGSGDSSPVISPRTSSTASIASIDPCDLLNGSHAEFQDVVDHYIDIQQAAEALGIQASDAGC